MIKIGLEIHQQLETHKLFCSCPSELVDEVENEFFRRLRPTESEVGTVDIAAQKEAEKGLLFKYQTTATSCLVEADEEPPHDPNQEAVDIALEIVKIFKAKFFKESYFMRKIVIDGSNTTGFQRTALLAVDGEIRLKKKKEKKVRIETICLEEDAARRVTDGETKGIVTYRLDRLGIPLIEITTAPDIESAEEAVEVARRIGSYLRATRKVKRGLGTIRQDVNVSVPGGTRIEIKGVQDLRAMKDVIKNEIARQKRLIFVAEELRKRGVSKEEISLEEVKDVSELFKDSKSKIVKSVLKKGGGVFALKLKGFGGFLGALKDGEPRCLGPEIASYVRKTGIKGLFHSDELPNYGISREEVEKVARILSLEPLDAFVLIAEKEEKAKKGFAAVVERARSALDGVPAEVRRANPDGTTTYLRPISSSARMYPETDVLPLKISEERFENIELPEMPEEKIERYVKEYGLSQEQARQIVGVGLDLEFEELVSLSPEKAKFTASLLLNTLPELEKEGFSRELLSLHILRDVVKIHTEKGVSKEGIFEILKYCLEKNSSPQVAFEKLGLGALDENTIKVVVKEVVKERGEFVKERGLAAVGPLMGVVMPKLKGKVEGKKVSKMLRKEIERFLKEE